MTNVLWIALGGGVGAVLRYLVHGWGQALTTGDFPLGTLLVNVIGCCLIGFLGVVLVHAGIRLEYRLALTVGLLGGFTTFSTFSADTLSLCDSGQLQLAFWNVISTNALCLAGAWSGFRLGDLACGA